MCIGFLQPGNPYGEGYDFLDFVLCVVGDALSLLKGAPHPTHSLNDGEGVNFYRKFAAVFLKEIYAPWPGQVITLSVGRFCALDSERGLRSEARDDIILCFAETAVRL